MACWLIRRVPHSPQRVFEAAPDAAAAAGFSVTEADAKGGHLYLNRARALGRSRRFDLAITDSGVGGTVLHVSWEGGGPRPWPLPSAARQAARFCRAVASRLTGPPG